MVHCGSASRPQSVPFPLTGALLHRKFLIHMNCIHMFWTEPNQVQAFTESAFQTHAASCCVCK